MLRIYPVCLQMVRDVRPIADQIARYDRDQARQLRRSSMSVVLTVGEGSGSRGGRRRVRYDDALASAKETLTNLEASQAAGYIRTVEPVVRNRLNHIIGTLVNVLY